MTSRRGGSLLPYLSARGGAGARTDDHDFGRTTNSDVLKNLELLKKLTADPRRDQAKPVTFDFGNSSKRQVVVRLSGETLAAIAHFAKDSGALAGIISKCSSLMNSATCEKLLRSLRDDMSVEIKIDGAINLSSVRLGVKGNVIRIS